ncbi:MAG: extracellular solute-binding protein [Limnochordia bacterium]|jgi:ABC-type glycerol-3-phosphate transport system substrate-binding protein
MTFRRRAFAWSVLLSIVLCLGILVESAPTVLRVFTDGSVEYLESTREFFERFEELNPDLTIEIETGNLDKFLVMYAANQTPDLLRLYGQFVPEYAARGLIQPLEPFLARSNIRKDLFFPVLVEDSLSYKGELYSISWGLAVTSLFLNVDRYEEVGLSMPDAPWRWEVEGIQAAKRLSRDVNGDNVLDQYFFQPIYGGTSSYAFMNMAGSEIFKGPYEYTADADEGVRGLQFLYELMSVHRAMPAPGASGGPWDLPVGHAASRIDGSWYVTTMLRHQPPFEWGIGNMPSFEGERGTSIWPETPWAIPTTAPNPELSWRIMEYIASPEGQQHVTLLGLAMPPLRLDIARTTFAKTYPMLMTHNIVDLALAPRTQTIPVSPASARSLLEGAISSVMNGREPAQQALARIRPQVETTIAEFIEKMVVR